MTENEIKIFTDNLKETLKAIEKFVMASIAASVFFLILSITNPALSDKALTKVPLIAAEAPPWIAGVVALSIYIVAGAFILLYYRNAQRISDKLRVEAPGVYAAAITYPSIMALAPTFRVTVILIVGGLGVLPWLPMYHESRWKVLLVALGFASPYWLLICNMIWEAAKERVRSRKEG